MFSFQNKKTNQQPVKETNKKTEISQNKSKNPFLGGNENTENPFLSSNNNTPAQMFKNPFAKKKKNKEDVVKPEKEKKFPKMEKYKIKKNEKATNSETFKGKGKDGNTIFAKKQIRAGDLIAKNASTSNVAAGNSMKNGKGDSKVRKVGNRNQMEVALKDTNLLAKAVASSRVDEALGTNILAKETYGKDKKTGEVLGISHGVAGKQVSTTKEDEMDIFKNPNTQKGFADLQVMDALSGQRDRHQGNMFLDTKTGGVKGIDNDSSFHTSNNDFRDGKQGDANYAVLSELFSTKVNKTEISKKTIIMELEENIKYKVDYLLQKGNKKNIKQKMRNAEQELLEMENQLNTMAEDNPEKGRLMSETRSKRTEFKTAQSNWNSYTYEEKSINEIQENIEEIMGMSEEEVMEKMNTKAENKSTDKTHKRLNNLAGGLSTLDRLSNAEQAINTVAGAIIYNQKLMDTRTAKSVINMKQQDFLNIIAGKMEDPEQITPQEANSAKVRFEAVKARAIELLNIYNKSKNEGGNGIIDGEGLVDNWDDETYKMLMNQAPQKTFVEQPNYLARVVKTLNYKHQKDK